MRIDVPFEAEWVAGDGDSAKSYAHLLIWMFEAEVWRAESSGAFRWIVLHNEDTIGKGAADSLAGAKELAERTILANTPSRTPDPPTDSGPEHKNAVARLAELVDASTLLKLFPVSPADYLPRTDDPKEHG
jgi:hypothetical protein